jgi:phospholipase C
MNLRCRYLSFTFVIAWLVSALSMSAFGQPAPQTGGVTSLNHIVILAQENRSLDSYFGVLRQYWRNHGYADISFDGLPQFNPTSGQPPLLGPVPSNPGCDPAFPPPADCTFNSNSPSVKSFHLLTQCTENTSPSWNESHNFWDIQDPVGLQAAKLNGYVKSAGHDGRALKYFDSNGIRAMGYYDGTDLNYYYYMASNFATSDRWFSPVMSRTHPNREYLNSATSQGYVYPVGANSNDKQPLSAVSIFEALQNAGISWKIYVNTKASKCTGPPFDPACLLKLSYMVNYVWGKNIPTSYPNNIADISQYFTDVQNGTLPQVALIEPASTAGLDEHPSPADNQPSKIQLGANYVAGLINALMVSKSWGDSAFILTFDEGGGLYDHVSPQPTVSPDGIPPVDLFTNPPDTCVLKTGPTCDFVYTGYRVPLIVVSPFTRKHYVSHTVMDYTAILRLIETRFGVSSLTARDAAQPDMTEFFDFVTPPWIVPPTPPVQNTKKACYLNSLP